MNPTPLIAPPAELIARYDAEAPRYTSYPTAPVWTAGFDAAAYANRLARASDPLSLYVHVPFCERLCTYCGCNMKITQDRRRADRYLDAVEGELALLSSVLGRRTVTQLHWGGGTPNFLTTAQMTRLVGTLAHRFALDPAAEISAELNPATVSGEQIDVLADLGFNRFSFGVQDFDDRVQKAINRLQTLEQTWAALKRARSAGVAEVNFDLVYGLPFQTEQTWARTLDELTAMRPNRVAIYAFAYLPQAIRHQRALPAAEIPRGKDRLALLHAAREALSRAGYVEVGLDHFALPNDTLATEALTRNFQGYSVKAARDLVGVGASAISDVGGAFAQNEKDVEAYQQRVAEGRFATVKGWARSGDDERRRAIIESLMCSLRADLGDADAWRPELGRLEPMRHDGLLAVDGNALQVTEIGRFFLRNIASVFDAYLPSQRTQFSRTV